MNIVTVIGAGLAGSECAWQLAQRGIPVILREMKPEKKTPRPQRNTSRSCAAPTPCAPTSWKRRGPFEGGAAPSGESDSLLCR